MSGSLHRLCFLQVFDLLPSSCTSPYDGAPSSKEFVRYNLSKALPRFGGEPIGELRPEEITLWRASLPEGRRHPALRAVRQVLEAPVRCKWSRVARRRPRAAGISIRRSWLKDDTKTAGSSRRIPLRARVVEALETIPMRRGILSPAATGGRTAINNWRQREWSPALEAAGVRHRRIYDLRHNYATWSLAAGVNIFTLARRMGTSVQMIDRAYGHLAANADDYERVLLDAFDRDTKTRGGRCVGAEQQGCE